MSELIVRTGQLDLDSDGDCHIQDITSAVAVEVAALGLDEGQVLVFVPGSTGALTTVEYEPGLLHDLPAFFERVAPKDMRYLHDETWHDGNGHSHVRASLLGPSLTVPVVGGELQLGTWQQIVFVDFDNRPRRRRLVVQVQGRGA